MIYNNGYINDVQYTIMVILMRYDNYMDYITQNNNFYRLMLQMSSST